ncbi:sulfite reductase subunit alpha [Massilia yuzhufengensis]|uniref:NADPH--hemoprotein reductase n=1 Tax=Massilia yuzhufengensis TaxID=1164594 RepID=A0A1I1HDK1_9BURK|nr:sulfite reductase subunit alpha [Massilia yuzhufengensis]SFC22014.1 sulfite reductase (NADPH) flavoprotein alpha-component [Massilia yuzhufengensis]
MTLTIDSLRLGSAFALSGGYLAMCLAIWRARAARRPAPVGKADWLVVYASQTGSAEYLAERTAATLATGGLSASAACMSDLDAGALSGASRILFIASTYGEGDAPDSGARFAGVTMGGAPDLSHLHYAVLALGDSSYTNYCGFGRALDGWLAAHGATPLFERIDVDRGNPAALSDWQHHIGRLAGTSDAPDWEAPAYADWRIASRVLANPGSAGAPLYQLALVPLDGVLPDWEAGDLAQVSAPADPDHPREYSIASLPREGRLELMVRLQRREDGSPGAASGWLCESSSDGDVIRMRVRAHQRFRLNGNAARPLIAIGNGSGLAGLRALLKSRIDAGRGDNWLLFGERHAAHDFLRREELQEWMACGCLERLDLAFSRDQATPRYVQHLVREQADTLRAWVARGAAIYVCGSLQGMAGGVHEALAEVLGAQALDALTAEGRYRRDVY